MRDSAARTSRLRSFGLAMLAAALPAGGTSAEALFLQSYARSSDDGGRWPNAWTVASPIPIQPTNPCSGSPAYWA